MSSMLINYWKESGKEYRENEHGFFTYSVQNSLFCVHDIYIKPESRSGKKCWELFSTIISLAIHNNCSSIEGYVDKDFPYIERSKVVLEKAGFKYHSENDACWKYRYEL